jgi:hypothetical protein
MTVRQHCANAASGYLPLPVCAGARSDPWPIGLASEQATRDTTCRESRVWHSTGAMMTQAAYLSPWLPSVGLRTVGTQDLRRGSCQGLAHTVRYRPLKLPQRIFGLPRTRACGLPRTHMFGLPRARHPSSGSDHSTCSGLIKGKSKVCGISSRYYPHRFQRTLSSESDSIFTIYCPPPPAI